MFGIVGLAMLSDFSRHRVAGEDLSGLGLNWGLETTVEGFGQIVCIHNYRSIN